MRILLANEARAGAGGVETYLSSIAGAMTKRGHAVSLLYGNHAAETGPTAIAVADAWSVADLGLVPALDRAAAWAPDVAYSHNMRRLEVDEALTSRLPVVKMMHGYFGTCVSGQKAYLFPHAHVCSRVCGLPCLALYAPRRCGQFDPMEMMANYRWATRQRALFPRYRSIVVASRHMRDEYLAHGVAADAVHAIPLFGTPAAASTQGDQDVDVVFLGRLTTLKGPDLLLDAMRIAAAQLGRRVTLTIAGEGPLRRALEAAAAAMSRVEVRVPGWLASDRRADLLSRARLLAVPSIWPEPFAMVGLEAAAFGVPAVAFGVGGIGEWLTDGVNGVMVTPPGDSDAMGRAIARLLQDPGELSRLAAGARAAAARLDLSTHVARLEAVMEAARRS